MGFAGAAGRVADRTAKRLSRGAYTGDAAEKYAKKAMPYAGAVAGTQIPEVVDNQVLAGIAGGFGANRLFTKAAKNKPGMVKQGGMITAGGAAGAYASELAERTMQNDSENQAQAPSLAEQQLPLAQGDPIAQSAQEKNIGRPPVVEPIMIDGVPTFNSTNVTPEIQKDLSDYAAGNMIESKHFAAADPATSGQIGKALKSAAGRGDWGGVQHHYESQGQGFGGGFVPRSKRQQTTFIPDSGRREAETRRLQQQISRPLTGDPKKDMTRGQRDALVSLHNDGIRRDLGMQTAAMRDAREGERTALDQQRLAMEQQTAQPQANHAQRMERLYQAYESSETPDEKASLAEQIRQLGGGNSRSAKDNYITVGGGQEWDEQSGTMRNVPQRLFDIENQQYITEGKNLPPIDQNPQALQIANNTKLSREERAEALRKLGY